MGKEEIQEDKVLIYRIGNGIPVIDTRLRFGMESKENDDRTVITVA